MTTLITKINKWNPEHEIISKASEILINGGLVAFPTETVYGLGADAMNSEAVKKIYQAKGRPSDNPLIFHVSSYEQAQELVIMNDIAEKLIKNFWPAPLTLVLNVNPYKKIPLITRGGLQTVAIRMPDNPIALALIEASKTPIAAPSANLSGRPSPTDFQSVFNDMNGKIDMIIDGGDTDAGIESTVIDVTNPEKILMLRPGGMPREFIEKVLNKKLEIPDEFSKKKSPGTRYRHYAPNIPVKIWENGKNFPCSNDDIKFCGYLGIKNPDIKNLNHKIIFNDIKNFAHGLFSAFRKFELEKLSLIVVEWPDENFGLSEGLRDRILRASN